MVVAYGAHGVGGVGAAVEEHETAGECHAALALDGVHGVVVERGGAVRATAVWREACAAVLHVAVDDDGTSTPLYCAHGHGLALVHQRVAGRHVVYGGRVVERLAVHGEGELAVLPVYVAGGERGGHRTVGQ